MRPLVSPMRGVELRTYVRSRATGRDGIHTAHPQPQRVARPPTRQRRPPREDSEKPPDVPMARLAGSGSTNWCLLPPAALPSPRRLMLETGAIARRSGSIWHLHVRCKVVPAPSWIFAAPFLLT